MYWHLDAPDQLTHCGIRRSAVSVQFVKYRRSDSILISLLLATRPIMLKAASSFSKSATNLPLLNAHRRGYTPFSRTTDISAAPKEDLVTVAVNGKPIEVPRGTSIIDACKKAKVYFKILFFFHSAYFSLRISDARLSGVRSHSLLSSHAFHQRYLSALPGKNQQILEAYSRVRKYSFRGPRDW